MRVRALGDRGARVRAAAPSPVNGYTYMGVSRFFVVDARVRYRVDRNWAAAPGIDNLGNYAYWNFHPYPQRSYRAELKYDLRHPTGRPS